MKNDIPIGVFDSGIGGITVLAQAIKHLPGQKFIYFGDTKNAPYGIKDSKEILRLTLEAAEFLTSKGIKALVVACNTATSAAIQELRTRLRIPVIGMEPALKLAVDKGKGGTILVMATPLTIKERKFNDLLQNFTSKVEVIPLACAGLVEIIEQGNWNGSVVENYLKEKFEDLPLDEITDVVLGCTHYIFIREEVAKMFNGKVNVLDGNEGTAKQLKKILEEKGLYDKDITKRAEDSLVEFNFSDSSEKPLNLYMEWINKNI